jgi:hypothetical protein
MPLLILRSPHAAAPGAETMIPVQKEMIMTQQKHLLSEALLRFGMLEKSTSGSVCKRKDCDWNTGDAPIVGENRCPLLRRCSERGLSGPREPPKWLCEASPRAWVRVTGTGQSMGRGTTSEPLGRPAIWLTESAGRAAYDGVTQAKASSLLLSGHVSGHINGEKAP